MATTFASAQKRTLIATMIGGYLVEVVCVFAAASSLRADNSLLVALVAPVLWHTVKQLMRLWDLIKNSAILWLFFRKQARAEVLADLIMENFPRPAGYYNDAFEYLGSVTQDPKASDRAKLKAARTVGYFEALRTYGPFSQSLFRGVTLESAINDYAKIFGDRDEEAVANTQAPTLQ